MKPSKRSIIAQMITDHPNLLQCPKCQEPLYLNDFGLVCTHMHRYDLSKRGYVHLLLKKDRSVYPQELFEARQRCGQKGVFDPLIQKIASLMTTCSVISSDTTVLDAGCGEGSLTQKLAAHDALKSALFCGIDIAKEGILQGSRESSSILWAVADLAQLPFQNHSFDCILNILSPANYKEFFRVLKPDGYILKVIPGTRYLQEIRNVVFHGTPNQSYDNGKIKEHFERHVEKMTVYPLSYTFTPDEETLVDLLGMTPLLLGKIPSIAQWEELKKVQTWHLDYEIILGKR